MITFSDIVRDDLIVFSDITLTTVEDNLWILEHGTWDDNGIWIDSETWKDN